MIMSPNISTEDTIDLKELFFALIAHWKLIALCIMLSLAFALLYLRVTPDTYSVDALVQVEDSKGAGTAALLGEELSKVVDQKSPAQAEIEILRSLVLKMVFLTAYSVSMTTKPPIIQNLLHLKMMQNLLMFASSKYPAII